MERENRATADGARIRLLIDARARAVRGRDLEGILAANVPTLVTYDVLPPLRNLGAEAVGARTRRWLEGYAEAPGYDIQEPEVIVGNDVAFAYYLYRVSGTLERGGDVNMWVRCTLGLRKLEGEWRIVHEHDSVPFDPESGRAALDLEP